MHDAPDPDLERKITRVLEAGDEADFVDRVFAPLHPAFVELEDLLPALADDGRVGAEYRYALAAHLDHLMYEFLEGWQTALLGGLDEGAGAVPPSP